MLTDFKKRLLFTAGIALGVIIVLAVFIILLNMDINDRSIKINELKDEITLRDQAIELLSASNTSLQKVRPAIKALENILPNKDELINFPREVEALAIKQDINVGFGFGDETPGDESTAGSIRFTMTLSGTFDNIIEFLNSIEDHRYFIAFDSVDIKHPGGRTFTLLTGGIIFTK